MPRGKYDRKESRIRMLVETQVALKEELRTTKEELARKEIELKASKKVAEAAVRVPATQAMPSEKFTILRSNLKILSESRQLLVNSEQGSEPVLTALDHEISSHLRLLASLRQETFGGEEKAAPETVPVPLPAQIPPFFQSARQKTG